MANPTPTIVARPLRLELDANDAIDLEAGDHEPLPRMAHERFHELMRPARHGQVCRPRVQSIDRMVRAPRGARLGIVTCGKAHFDLLDALRRIEVELDDLAAAGVRVYKVGLAWPIEPTRMLEFARGLDKVLVVEEKGAVVEQQMRELHYNEPPGRRPVIVGKTDAKGAPLLPDVGELRPSRVLPVLAEWLARHRPTLDRRDRVVEFVRPVMPSNTGDRVRRVPYFRSGSPHNTSTRVPEGSRAQAGIGCHAMAMWMDRDTTGLIQMGGEGVDSVAHAQFTRAPHVFQNLGDGTYFHSGYLAIRQALAAGTVTVDSIARQVHAEGVRGLGVVSDEPGKYAGREALFPPGTRFHGRDELDAVQRDLRATPGVSVLVYDQTCAAEKRRIDQSSCNKDYSCADGFCPSFVSVTGGRLRRPVASLDAHRLAVQLAAVPDVEPASWRGPYDLLVTGVGGNGMVAVGAVIAMVAHCKASTRRCSTSWASRKKGVPSCRTCGWRPARMR